MFTLYQRCLACICRRSRCRASTLTGTREACRVVSVGQNWRLDCNRSLHSAAELVPGRSIDTVSFCGWGTLPRRGRPLRIHILQYTLEQDGKLLCNVLIIHGKPVNSCICYQDGVETLCLDIPLLDPTGDFSGPRAPGSFFPVKDVWIPYYWFLRQTSHITCLNGFNDRGTPAGREPDIKNVHHIDGSKPFLEACKQPFCLGFPGFFPRPFGRLSSVLQITFTNPLAARLSSIDLLGRCLDAEFSISL